eukprot:PLAT6465.1.p1 GENE.PLAT6465.1~~PLAT6465.1.p1  ORF type:complete len:344 (+),score=67.29 PLAT6465.1:88-1119(+)
MLRLPAAVAHRQLPEAAVRVAPRMMRSWKSIVPIVAGPTAAGKSAFALALARRVIDSGGAAEIINADASAVYKKLEIGVGKPTEAEQQAVPHRLLSIAEPEEDFSIAAWLPMALQAVRDCQASQSLPILCGGSHMYLSSFLRGRLVQAPSTPFLRQWLDSMSTDSLWSELCRLDSGSSRRLHRNDRHRVVRALEVAIAAGRPWSELLEEETRAAPLHGRRSVFVVVDASLDWLLPRITARVHRMLDAGLLKEVESLQLSPQLNASRFIGHAEMSAVLAGQCSMAEATDAMVLATRQLARAQRKWVRRLCNQLPSDMVIHVDASAIDGCEQAQQAAIDTVLQRL